MECPPDREEPHVSSSLINSSLLAILDQFNTHTLTPPPPYTPTRTLPFTPPLHMHPPHTLPSLLLQVCSRELSRTGEPAVDPTPVHLCDCALYTMAPLLLLLPRAQAQGAAERARVLAEYQHRMKEAAANKARVRSQWGHADLAPPSHAGEHPGGGNTYASPVKK